MRLIIVTNTTFVGVEWGAELPAPFYHVCGGKMCYFSWKICAFIPERNQSDIYIINTPYIKPKA